MTVANILVLLFAFATLAALVSPAMRGSRLWRATATPLASIIGSGFLVLGPILAHAFGIWATAAMAGLCLAAWGFGMALRDNIRHAEGLKPEEDRALAALAGLSDIALVGAYFISVAYYLNLFGAFGVRLTPFDGPFEARLLTSAMLCLLLLVGWTRGFEMLERAEIATVTLKLAVIAGLIAGLVVHSGSAVLDGAAVIAPPTLGPVAALTLGFGLIVTVQGFETSRYLGAKYEAELRIRSMRLAQIVAAGIYIVYVALLSVGFHVGEGALSETAIIDLMAQAAPILPPLLVLAALSAQASAAIADAGGAGGLLSEVTGGRLSAGAGYAVLVLAGLTLTWASNVFEIISYASRAFAIYYALQSMIAARLAWRRRAKVRSAFFLFLASLGAAAAAFGVPAEGG